MNLQEAIDAPAWHIEHFPLSFWPRTARPGVLDRHFESRGLRYYALGFGFREADRFPLAIIEKFDLHPRYVVVNADGFFTDSLSEVAEQAIDESSFVARRRRWEATAAHTARRTLHRLIPNWIDLFGRPGFLWRREVIGYRSRANGTWEVYPWEPARWGVEGRDLANIGAASKGANLVTWALGGRVRSKNSFWEFGAAFEGPLVGPRDLLQYRFPSTSGVHSGGLAGHALGNLLIAAATEIEGGDFEEGVRRLNRILAVRGQVVPVTATPLTLHATCRDGSTVDGQSRIMRTATI